MLKQSILITTLAIFSLSACSHEIQREFNYIDKDSNGGLSYTEFYVLMMQYEIKEMEKKFQLADLNEDNSISLNEADIFEVTDQEYYQADLNGNSSIDMKEFLEAYIFHSFAECDQDKDQNISFEEYRYALQND